MMGGLLIYIVPYYRLTADLCGIICDNFEQVRIHRFLDREFKQFKQVVVTGVRRRRTEAEQDAEALCSAAEHRRPYLPPTFCPRPAMSSRQSPKGGDIPGLCSMKTSWPASWQTPPALTGCLPKAGWTARSSVRPALSIGQVGLIGGSGLINGLMECDYPHIVKGRIIKEKHTVTDENRGPMGA